VGILVRQHFGFSPEGGVFTGRRAVRREWFASSFGNIGVVGRWLFCGSGLYMQLHQREEGKMKSKHIYALVIEEELMPDDSVTVTISATVIETTAEDASASLPNVVGTYSIPELDDLHQNMGDYIGEAIHNYWVLADDFGGELHTHGGE